MKEQRVCARLLYYESFEMPVNSIDRVATNLENLEYSGISQNMETWGILRELCTTLEKNCNKTFSSSFKYLCKTAVDWVNSLVNF